MTLGKVTDAEDLQVLRESLYARYGRDFQSAAERFDEEGARRWSRAYDWYLRGWLPANRAARIADLACGGGNLLFFFRERGYRKLIGVDIGPDQVARARQVVPDIVCTDALEWLERHESSFDLLTALDLIEHLTRAEALRFLERCHRALKPGGRLILQTPNAGAPFGMDLRYGDPTHEWCYNANQLTRLLRRAGLHDVEIREQGPVPWGLQLRLFGPLDAVEAVVRGRAALVARRNRGASESVE